jgi:A/G-specific adenine glycosylase
MLQQTRVNRVLQKYPEFLHRFPTLKALAAARQREVVTAWQGMGYNNRAVRLHRLAILVRRDRKGKLPNSYEGLLALPGIGKYTANAVLSSTFRKRVATVDTNIRRVLSRLLWRMRSLGEVTDEQRVWSMAEALLPRRAFYEWNQALMDLGSTVCTARAPKCNECPVLHECASAKSMLRTGISQRSTEPSFLGIPNRVYRGRVIELLRNAGRAQRLSIEEIKNDLLPRNGHRNTRWLKSLLRSLEKDGLIVVNGHDGAKGTVVSLA